MLIFPETNSNSKLAVQMLIVMVAGIVTGLLFMALRENVGADSSLWMNLNRFLFQDITAAGAENAIGLFYICGQEGSTGSNPLQVILNIIPSNISAVFSINNSVLSIVFIAVVVGLGLNVLNLEKESQIYKLCQEVSNIIVVFLNFVVIKFGPAAIFMLLCRTFATYGIDYLKPALAYFVLCVLLLLAYLFIGYPLYIGLLCKQNPIIFIKKIFKDRSCQERRQI